MWPGLLMAASLVPSADDASARQVSALNGSGRAPRLLTLERLAQEGFSELPPYHPYTITVPGACAGWCDLLERFGSLPLPEVLSPAIRLAEQGFPVAPLTSHFWGRGAERQLRNAPGGQELTIDGRGPHPGEIFRNPGLGRTLQSVAEGGKAVYYQGPIAEAIASTVQAAGGWEPLRTEKQGKNGTGPRLPYALLKDCRFHLDDVGSLPCRLIECK